MSPADRHTEDLQEAPGDIEEEIQRIGAWLRHGSARKGVDRLRLLCRTKIPRRYLLPVAELARHAQLPELSLRLLNPVVRTKDRKPESPARQDEIRSYAAALIQVGAFEEAQSLLKSLDTARSPEVLMEQGLYHFRRWDWEATVPALEEYLSRPGIEPFRQLWARVYLGAALVKQETDTRKAARGRELLTQAVAQSGPEQARVLHRAALTYLAQDHIFRSEWSEALGCLDRLERESPERDKQFFDLIARKWRCLVEMRRSGASGARRQELASIRDELSRWGHWEYARSCDYYSSRYSRDDLGLVHVYAGTPYPALRAQITAARGSAEVPEVYDWRLGPADKGGGPWLNAAEGSNSKTKARLKEGQLVHRLLETLCSDFYRPLRIPELHAQLHPGEHFHPVASPARVHQVFKRLRDWLVKQGLPHQIEEMDSGYRLSASKPCSVHVRIGSRATAAAPGLPPRAAKLLQKLRTDLASAPFSVSQAAKALDCSSRSALRYLQLAREAGLVSVEGEGPGTKYRFKA